MVVATWKLVRIVKRKDRLMKDGGDRDKKLAQKVSYFLKRCAAREVSQDHEKRKVKARRVSGWMKCKERSQKQGSVGRDGGASGG